MMTAVVAVGCWLAFLGLIVAGLWRTRPGTVPAREGDELSAVELLGYVRRPDRPWSDPSNETGSQSAATGEPVERVFDVPDLTE